MHMLARETVTGAVRRGMRDLVALFDAAFHHVLIRIRLLVGIRCRHGNLLVIPKLHPLARTVPALR